MTRTCKSWIMLIAILVMISGSAYSQLGLRTGIKAGYGFASISDISGANIETKSLKGLTAGISLEASLLGLLTLQGDLLYAPKGVEVDVPGGPDEIKLTYLSIPVVLKVKFFPALVHPYLLAGPEYNILLSAKYGDTDIKEFLKKSDMAIVIGGGLEFGLFGKSAYAEARLNYSLQEFQDDDLIDLNGLGDSMKNRAVQIFVGILF